MKIKKRSMFISLLPLLLLVGAAYADTVSNVIIPIQGCNAEDNAAAAGTFGGVCDFPDGSALISDDGNVETHSADRSGTRYWGGVNTTSYNSSETECIAITSVMVCYEWWSSTTGQDCDVSVDADGGASYTAITTTCPGTTPNPGVVCYNATATESWSCSNFFGASGTRARIKSEGRKSGGNGAQTYTWDVLYFNVTYKRDREAPNVTLIAPPNGTTLYSNNVLFQYNVSDESAIANCSLIINGVVNQTNTTVTRNVTQNFTATLGAGNYNWSVNCTDNSTNKNQGSSATWQFTVAAADMIPPYVIINSPANNTLFNVSSISINITATDLNLNYTNVSLINSTGAVVNSTINTTNGTFVVQLGVPYDGVYNITATAYDKANNTNTTTVKNITVLLTPPSININYPYNDSLINSSTISINLTVISIGINYTNVSLINSTGSVVNSTASTNTGTYIVQLGIPYDDIFNITATAYDLVGRSNSSTRTNLSVDMPPAIAFTSITPANGTVTMNNTFEINISVNETSLRRFVWNWNGTNYTLYDSNLKLMLNFNNVSALGENSSSNYTADTSLFNNICVCAGMGAGCSWTAGKHGAALSFNGSTSYVDCGNSTNLTNMTTSLSMEAWIYPNEWMTLYDTILESSTGGEGYRIWSPAGGTSIGATIYNGTSVVRVNSDLTLATWTHVLATYNGSDFILYINGMAVNTTITSGSITTTTPRFAIGRDTALGRYFNGRIDEVRIYNRVLSPSEVLDHYQSSLYKYDKNKWAFYINPSNLTEGVYTYQGFANDSRGSTGQTSPSPRYITIIHPTNLTIWDDTDVSRKYVNDSVKFYANYTSARNGNPVVGASCNISFETPAGWTTPVSMNYNVTSKLYEYNRTFNFSGTYNFSVNCSKQFYQAHNATSTYWITGAVVYVYTDQNTYQACNILYYKIWVYDASDSLIDSNLTIKIYNSSNSLQNATSANTGNGGTGVYLGNYILNSTSDLGKWLIEVVASSIVKGTQNFFIGTAPTRWKIDIDFSPDSIVYNSGTNITMNFTVWTKEGVRQTGLLPGDLSVLIDNTNVTAGLSASGEGYVYSYTASPGHHIVNATSGNVTNIRGFTVR